MEKRSNGHADWRALYVGEIADQGYDLELEDEDLTKISIDPADLDIGRIFIRPKSEKRGYIVINNLEEPAFLDLMNLECGVLSTERILNFVNKYGCFLPERESVATLLAAAKLNRELLGKVIDTRKGVLLMSQNASCRVHIKLETRQLEIETRSLPDFIHLQIAQIYSLGLTIANCDECGAYMMPSCKTRKHCSDACRQRAHRMKSLRHHS